MLQESLNSLSSQELTELQSLLELERLDAAKDTLSKYARYIVIPGAPVRDDEECEEFYPDNVEPAQHHDLLLDALQLVADGQIKNLMVFMPPGSAKSTYASVVFPTWFMGKFKNKNIIQTTYNSPLAQKFGRKCRSIARSFEFQQLFTTSLTGDNSAVDNWSLLNGSTYMCGGILSGITGNRADGLIIDDPVSGREDADSETMRDKIWDAYVDDLDTRLKPSGFRIIIMTRWHEDDLCGRILPEGYNGESGWIKSRTGDDWYVISLQAECEQENDPLGRKIGDWLWTDWFPVHWWIQKKKDKTTPSARSWNSLYQQRPSADEGDYFKREWIRWYDETPAHLRKYGASDYAVTDKGGDYTVHLAAGVDPNDDIYLLDLWRDQSDSSVWVEAFIDLIKRHKPVEWAEEAGQIAKSLDPLISKRQREEKAYCLRTSFPSSADKQARAQSIRGRMAQGKVYFPRNAPWVQKFIDELMAFDAGKYDDQVDAFGLLGRLLDGMLKGKKPPEETKPKWELEQTFNELRDQHAKARRAGNDGY